jgi:hypothetical protein
MHFFLCQIVSKKITIYGKLSGGKNQFGMVIEVYCSGKTSASKMNKKKNFVQWFKNGNLGTIFAYMKVVH